MNFYNKILIDSIEREKAGLDYACNEHDRHILNKLFKDINANLNTDIHYIAELDSFNLAGAGIIMLQYIHEFEAESMRAYLIPQIVSDKIGGADKLVCNLYQKFKKSDEYIATADKPSPAHIYTRYDTAISMLKPKKLKSELLEVVNTPRDIYYLPLTTQMLASWKLKEFRDLLLHCAKDSEITYEDVGLSNDNKTYYPSYETLIRQLKFIVINCLRYYPTCETLEFLKKISCRDDLDLQSSVNKAVKYINKRLV